MKSNKSILGLGLLVSLMASSQAVAKDFDIEETRSLTLEAFEVSQLRIDAGSGFLKIKGVEDLSEIRVKAELKVNENNFLFTLEKNGNVAELIADANPENESQWWGDGPVIDLTIEMPISMALKVKDGSGELVIDRLNGNIDLDDGSGSVSISNVVGNLEVVDGSGSFHLENLKGDLALDDGSGSITIENVDGNVQVEDGSGSTTIDRVTGKLSVEDGSGSLSISHIGGHVTVDDGSGGIKLSHLADGVTILNDGSGGLSMSDVKGKVDKR